MRQYYRNVEVKKLFHVADNTVGSWIERARQGRNDLEIVEHEGRFFIAENERNRLLMKALVDQGKKYINSRSRKDAHPKSHLYEVYSQDQIFDIFDSIETVGELPLQYSYFDGGAKYWDKYANELAGQGIPNMLLSTIELLEKKKDFITELAKQHKRVNVIDLGVGNALPVKKLLNHLLELGVLGRYIAIDTSKSMIDIAEHNIKEWFGGRVNFEGHVRNFEYDRFGDLLKTEFFDDSNSVNLVLLFGGTLTNLHQPEDALHTIRKSMGKNDVLLYALKLDTESARRFFDVPFDTQFRMPLDLLGIEGPWYEIEKVYDAASKMRSISIRLNVTLSIQVKFGDRTRTLNIDRGDSVLIWRYWHQSARDVMNQFYDNGFDLLETSLTSDHKYVLVAASIQKSR
ncbi:MAG TPA: L-histidine N(alpha)-methyltransferase [Patescibacteria group bacterium]|jgi:uncharacterized SAM-dependent methyltransferase|nr:L-histidine N(alpha)-methyltransferase [Patescibacteria group bacterium]